MTLMTQNFSGHPQAFIGRGCPKQRAMTLVTLDFQNSKPKSVSGSWEERKAILAANQAAQDEWQRAGEVYREARRADPRFKVAVGEFVDLQNREPQRVMGGLGWLYKNKVCDLNQRNLNRCEI